MAIVFAGIALLVFVQLVPSVAVWLLCAAAALLLAWYVMYGLVGLAFFFSQAKKTAISNFFLWITVCPTLLPFRKAFYFWTKSVNMIQKNPANIEKADFERAFALAQKVRLDCLRSDNNKALFLSYIASMYYDSGDKEKAYSCIQEARGLPCKKAAVEEAINRLVDLIDQSENPNINTEDPP
jgi:hypothetical protein